MAICQLTWLDFIVYTRSDLHVERIYVDELEWKENRLNYLRTHCRGFDGSEKVNNEDENLKKITIFRLHCIIFILYT